MANCCRCILNYFYTMENQPGQNSQFPSFLFCEALLFKFWQKFINSTTSIQWLQRNSSHSPIIIVCSLQQSMRNQFPATPYQWRSPWLQATTCCMKRTTAASGESKSFTLSLLYYCFMELEQGITLQVSSQACNQTGEISHFQVFWKPIVSEGGKASQGMIKQKIYLVMFWFIHSSHGDSSYKSARPGKSSPVQFKASYQKLQNLSAQVNVSPYELISGQPFNFMERADTYNVETVSRSRCLQQAGRIRFHTLFSASLNGVYRPNVQTSVLLMST